MPLASQIDRASPLPLYAQIKRRLRATIMAWPVGNDRFHSDHELCALFEVSRATIRQAIASLEQEGLLRRQQGFGTFVNRQKIEESFTPNMNFFDQWARSGRALNIEVLSIAQLPCPEPFATMLALAADQSVTYVERYRLSGSLRVAWDRRFIPVQWAEGLPKKALRQVSILDALGTVVELDRGDNHIEAALAGDEYAELLDLLPQDPVLIRHLTYYSTAGEPVLAGVSVYRADQMRYSLSVPMRGADRALNPGGSGAGSMRGDALSTEVRTRVRPDPLPIMRTKGSE